jgi:hypothetical protein
MPQHGYFCHACKRPFSKTLTPAEYEQGAPYAHIAAAKKWNSACRLSTRFQGKRPLEGAEEGGQR